MKRKALITMLFIPMMGMSAQGLDLKDITDGQYYAEGISVLEASKDGESYTQLSDDGRRIIRYSFKTGKETETLFDVSIATGAKLEAVEGYIMSPDGKRILIQTNTNSIYRHSFTADYYIYTVANKKLVPLSKNGAQQTPLFSPDGTMIAFVRNNNIFLIKLLYDNAESQVTKDGKKNEVIMVFQTG
jgi:dipeptidyl-peptidase-4